MGSLVVTYEECKKLLRDFSIPKAKHWNAIFSKIDSLGGGSSKESLSTLDFKVLPSIRTFGEISSNISANPSDSPKPFYLMPSVGSHYLVEDNSGFTKSLGIRGARGETKIFLKDEHGITRIESLEKVYNSAIGNQYRVYKVLDGDLNIGDNLIEGKKYDFELKTVTSGLNAVELDVFSYTLQFDADGFRCSEGLFYVKGDRNGNADITIPMINPSINPKDFSTVPSIEFVNISGSPMTFTPLDGVTFISDPSVSILEPNGRCKIVFLGENKWLGHRLI